MYVRRGEERGYLGGLSFNVQWVTRQCSSGCSGFQNNTDNLGTIGRGPANGIIEGYLLMITVQQTRTSLTLNSSSPILTFPGLLSILPMITPLKWLQSLLVSLQTLVQYITYQLEELLLYDRWCGRSRAYSSGSRDTDGVGCEGIESLKSDHPISCSECGGIPLRNKSDGVTYIQPQREQK